MCILAYVVCVYVRNVRTYVTRAGTSAINLRRYGNTPQSQVMI